MHVDSRALRDFLITGGLVTRSQLEGVLARGEGESLYDTLAARGIISEDELRRAAAHVAGVNFVLLSPHDIAFETLALIPEPISRAHNIVAYKREGNMVEVALLDLADLERVDFLRGGSGLTILPRLTTADSIKQTLHHYQQQLKEKFKVLIQHSGYAVDALIRHALLSRATGIHLDLRETGFLVRYRIQGMLHEAMLLPREAAHIFARLKDLAGLSHTLHIPQEGRFKAEIVGGSPVGVHVVSTPTISGERMRLHLMPERTPRQGFTLESLGLHGKALEDVHALLQKRDGLIVVAGPEGAGKTTTLYTMLDMLGERGASIATVEREVEYTLPHAAQTKVRPELGLNTAAALRAVLKQDPDIVMIGDVDGGEVALMAAQAAARGILVLAGVEALSAAGAIEQLRGWDLPPLLIASTLRGVVAVEVVKKLCTHEREEYRLARAELAPLEAHANFGAVLAALKDEEVVDKDKQWKELLFARAVECAQCEGGYQGLVGLQEVLPITATSKELIQEGASAEAIDIEARGEGVLVLGEDGLFKAAQGQTSVEEVERVLRV